MGQAAHRAGTFLLRRVIVLLREVNCTPMTQKLRVVPFSEFVVNLTSILDELTREQTAIVVERDGRRYRMEPQRPAEQQGRSFTMEDPFWKIVGIGASAGATDVSTNKHKYLAATL